jgi:hypothetical protein
VRDLAYWLTSRAVNDTLSWRLGGNACDSA